MMVWLAAIFVGTGVFLAYSAFAIATANDQARLAAMFAMPQRRTIVRSRFVERHKSVKNLVRRIWDIDLWRDHHTGRVDLDMFDPSRIYSSPLAQHHLFTHAPKRVMDIACSLSLLIFAFPLLLVVAVLIKLDSPGPVFYRQKRVGFRGKEFDVIKFRTMTVDAEKDGARWAQVNDVRVTRIGRFLRNSRIDEIPQIIPILWGHMSFVGPRPERPEFTGQLSDAIHHFDLRHHVKPGLTGWAQVMVPYGASVEDARLKLSFDLYYISNYSLLLDIFIVVKTVRVALFAKGSR